MWISLQNSETKRLPMQMSLDLSIKNHMRYIPVDEVRHILVERNTERLELEKKSEFLPINQSSLMEVEQELGIDSRMHLTIPGLSPP